MSYPGVFRLDVRRTALVITDPQVDFLSPQGATWGVVGQSVESNNTVQNIERLLRAARQANMVVAISPHYYYPSDHRWGFGDPLEKLMNRAALFDRMGPVALERFEQPGADLARRLREYRVAQVILAGMSANLCLESHLRALLELGFEVAVVKDATAAATLSDQDGYLAALTNFRYIANALWSTDETLRQIWVALPRTLATRRIRPA